VRAQSSLFDRLTCGEGENASAAVTEEAETSPVVLLGDPVADRIERCGQISESDAVRWAHSPRNPDRNQHTPPDATARPDLGTRAEFGRGMQQRLRRLLGFRARGGNPVERDHSAVGTMPLDLWVCSRAATSPS
jgi:hypothetical protein